MSGLWLSSDCLLDLGSKMKQQVGGMGLGGGDHWYPQALFHFFDEFGVTYPATHYMNLEHFSSHKSTIFWVYNKRHVCEMHVETHEKVPVDGIPTQ